MTSSFVRCGWRRVPGSNRSQVFHVKPSNATLLKHLAISLRRPRRCLSANHRFRSSAQALLLAPPFGEQPLIKEGPLVDIELIGFDARAFLRDRPDCEPIRQRRRVDLDCWSGG